MKYLIILMLAACDPVAPKVSVDQCLRQELFDKCMSNLPAGPQVTKYNDWDEVVSECDGHAYRAALRLTETIKQECKAA